MKKILLFSLVCLIQITFVSGQIVKSNAATIRINNKPKVNVNATPDSRQSGMNVAPNIKGKYYALIIGINDYIDPLVASLDKPIRDAEVFYNAITSRYTFNEENVKLIRNATSTQIYEALDYFAEKVKPEDSFLIFYAGHGVWDESAQIGYWLPSDARRNSKKDWFRNSTLRDYLREIKSKHTLLISDACFGGSIFKTRAAFTDATFAINSLYELPSRKAMTSGTMTEVPDQSAFLKYLVERLNNNTEKYLSSEQLFSSLRMAVINNSKVVPQYGVIQDVDDQGGDFIFILKE
jgi:Caspase domain